MPMPDAAKGRTAGHTPGPWAVNISRRSDGEIVVAHVVTQENGISIAQMSMHENVEANTALIAAAPDMLAALKFYAKFETWHRNKREDEGDGTAMGPLLSDADVDSGKLARAALSRTER